MRLSIVWRIMEIEEGVIRRGCKPRRLTPSKIIPRLKTQLKNAYLHRSIDVKFIFDSARFRVVQLRKYSPNSRCRPSSCLLVVLAMFLAIISPSSNFSSHSWNEWNVRHFFSQPNYPTSSPGLLGNGALTCRGLHFRHHFLVKHKIFPNLVISNWLWWIMRMLLADQN